MALKYRKQKRGEVATYCKRSMAVVQWTDKRTLVMLTTKHTNEMVSIPAK